jgi:hypothetical protein
MALTLATWNTVVGKKWSTSSAFKELDTAVKAYINSATPLTLSALKTKWTAWTSKLQKDGKTYLTSDRYVKGGALDDVAALCQGPGIGAPASGKAVPLPAIPQPVVNQAALQAAVFARENRVVAKKTANLVFTMAGPTNLSINTPLRYNMRKTGLGRQDAEVLVTLPIKVHNGPAAKAYWTNTKGWSGDSFDRTVHGGGKLGVTGATANADVLKVWTKSINDWWGSAAVIHHPLNGPRSYYRLKFEFTFTDDASKACAEVCCVRTSGEAAAVNPSGTIDAVRWGADDSGPGGPICHEVGHFLGCPDEYYTITYDGVTRSWGEGYTIEGVMNNPNSKPLARHYRKMGQELANQFGFNPDEASIILNTTLSLENSAQKGHRLAGHIWD